MYLGNEIRQVVRRLRRAPLFTAVTLLTIAIGVGANSAVFSVVNGVLLKPLPYSDPNSLVVLWYNSPPLKMKNFEISPGDYFTFRDENRTFQHIGAWTGGSVAVTGTGTPENVRALNVTQGTLDSLGVPPYLGRWFTSADAAPSAPRSAIVTFGYWQRHFGGNPAALGGQLILDGKPATLIGVMPRTFRFLDEKPEILVPLQWDPAKTNLGNYSYSALARLKPGIAVSQANADVARMIPLVIRKFSPPPGFSASLFEQLDLHPNVAPLRDQVVGDLGRTLWVLMGSIAVVLLIACANVANLLLVRAEGRRQELATRMALGASSSRIALSLLAESLLLGLLGGLSGLAVAYGALRLLAALDPPYLPRLDNISLDPSVILFTLATSLAAGFLFGIIPAWKFASPNSQAMLRGGGRSISQSRERHRARNILVVVQTALAVLLLIGAGLMIRTFQSLRQVDPGFTAPAQLQTARIDIPDGLVKEPSRVLRLQQEIRRKIEALPGVLSVSYANSVPTDGNNSTDVLYVEDRPPVEGQLPTARRFKFIAPGFFHAMGARLVAGHDLTWTDLEQRRSAVVVSENLARELWRQPSAAVGKRIRENPKDPWFEIVGVVADIHYNGPDQPPPATVYWPVAFNHFWGADEFIQRRSVFVVRSDRAGSQSLRTELQQAVWSVVPDVPVVNIRTMEEVYRASMARSSFTLVMLAIAGGMALLLGIIGIYGVISYSVSQRTRELGIRVALGASASGLRGMVVWQGIRLTAIGAAVGLAVACAATRVMSSLLFHTSALDPLTFGLAAVALLAASALASYLPARTASAANPVEALRGE